MNCRCVWSWCRIQLVTWFEAIIANHSWVRMPSWRDGDVTLLWFKPIDEEIVANLRRLATGNWCKDSTYGELGGQRCQRAPPASWRPSKPAHFPNSEQWEHRCWRCRHDAAGDLNSECRLAVRNHTAWRGGGLLESPCSGNGISMCKRPTTRWVAPKSRCFKQQDGCRWLTVSVWNEELQTTMKAFLSEERYAA